MTDFPQEQKRAEEKLQSPMELILFNDDYHSFDFVIEQLIKHCKHSELQAEQSALIAHHKGECSVLLGEENAIVEAYNKLSDKGLLVETRHVSV